MTTRDDCGGEDGTAIVIASEEPHDEDRYKPDMGKNVIYHSFDFAKPEMVVRRGHHQPAGNRRGWQSSIWWMSSATFLLDWEGDPQLPTKTPAGCASSPSPSPRSRGLGHGPGGALPPGRRGQREAGGHLHAAHGRL